ASAPLGLPPPRRSCSSATSAAVSPNRFWTASDWRSPISRAYGPTLPVEIPQATPVPSPMLDRRRWATVSARNATRSVLAEGGTDMKALVYHGPGNRAWEEVPDPVIREPTDAIVRIESSTICGTDLHILKGDVREVAPGTILGHEAVGTVVEVGTAVATLNP